MMNQKDIIKLSITAILAVVLILLVANSGNAVKKAQELRKKTLEAPELSLVGRGKNDQSVVLSGSQVGKFTYKKLEEVSGNLVLTRDPFSSLPASVKDKVAFNTLTLSGILFDKDKPMAIINGDVVKIGQRVGSQKVVEIKRDRVILSDGVTLSEVKLQH